MRYPELVYETLTQASEKDRLEKIDFPGVLDTEHIQIIAQKQDNYWEITLYPKDEIGELIRRAYEKLKKSEALTRDLLSFALWFIINNS
ncbi:hypothetical protein [Acidianus bottle-shaped virus 3 strain ABV3]|uniref:Uncharacterized protein n=1 Tax=Acidianus bottle-shaped virus 3 strain ABV3 TaxID=1732174 RepID=A0A0N9P4J9_9VIRU|nr:hypothetical protein AVU00_gp31 [Acidianus bottle-shaped virus 3 strain ABV3]ALG96833.1 hypothetical protein [Acidianus bottle-shaped virus 3 strain ABV3]